MPTVVYQWDFEDGTTQGWSVGGYTSLDSTGKLQGTYSLKWKYPSGSYVGVGNSILIASISGIDLSTTSKPILVVAARIDATSTYAFDIFLRVVIKDGSGTTIHDSKHQINNYAAISGTLYRIVAADISDVAGQTNLTIELYAYAGDTDIRGDPTLYLDIITILDGADIEYQAPIMADPGEAFIVSINPADNVSALNATRIGFNDASGDKFDSHITSWTFEVSYTDALANAVTLKFSGPSGINRTERVQYGDEPDTIATVDTFTFNFEFLAATVPTNGVQKVVIVLADANWNIVKAYMVTIVYNILAFEPSTFTAVHTTTYGSTSTGSKNVTLHFGAGTSLDVALHVAYIEGDNTLITSGSVTMEVWDSTLTTQLGTSTVDLTVGTDLTGAYVTGLTPGDYVLKFSWSITANARVVLKIDVKSKVTV